MCMVWCCDFTDGPWRDVHGGLGDGTRRGHPTYSKITVQRVRGASTKPVVTSHLICQTACQEHVLWTHSPWPVPSVVQVQSHARACHVAVLLVTSIHLLLTGHVRGTAGELISGLPRHVLWRVRQHVSGQRFWSSPRQFSTVLLRMTRYRYLATPGQ